MAVNPPFTAIQPNHLTLFIGRNIDLQRLIDILQNPSVRLITILGSGGIGKTSLALELAGRLQNEFPRGLWVLPTSKRISSSKRHIPLSRGLRDITW